MSPIEDKHPDVLQNIEFAIVMIFKDHPEMSDYDVMRMLEALIDSYHAQESGRQPRNARLSDLEQLLIERARDVCEWRLGRGSPSGDTEKAFPTDITPISIDEIILCLKRILKSVKRWNETGGRQGYLKFVVQYVR